jgi:predicted Zn-dependent protease
MNNIKKLFSIWTLFIFAAGIFSPDRASGITIKQENDLSHEFMKAVSKQCKFIKDPLIVNYVNKVGQKIVSVLPSQPFTYRFYVIKKDDYNAFASPAGNIFINSGLLAAMENEEELAGILGHEIAHVQCRHISDMIDRSKKIGIATIAGLAAGILLGAGGAAAVGNAVTAGTMAAGQSIGLIYSRENEMQADQIGMKYLTKAGYTGAGLLKMLKKIRGKTWFGTNQIPTYLKTHPAVEDRIAYIDLWLDGHQQKIDQECRINPDDFAWAHTRLIAVYGEERSALNQFETAVNKGPKNPMAHYGYGLILARTGKREDAITHLQKALKKKPFDPYILKDLGKVYFSAGRYPEALNALESAASLAAYDDPEGLFLKGRAQMELGMLKEAVFTFEDLAAKKPDYKKALYFLGESYGKLGKLGEAHYYLGVYHKNRNDFKNALFHLNKALKKTHDPDRKLEIEKMLKELRKNGLRTNRSTPLNAWRLQQSLQQFFP